MGPSAMESCRDLEFIRSSDVMRLVGSIRALGAFGRLRLRSIGRVFTFAGEVRSKVDHDVMAL